LLASVVHLKERERALPLGDYPAANSSALFQAQAPAAVIGAGDIGVRWLLGAVCGDILEMRRRYLRLYLNVALLGCHASSSLLTGSQTATHAAILVIH
jgi:hypothetical protein